MSCPWSMVALANWEEVIKNINLRNLNFLTCALISMFLGKDARVAVLHQSQRHRFPLPTDGLRWHLRMSFEYVSHFSIPPPS